MRFCARCSAPHANKPILDRWFCNQCFWIVADWIVDTRLGIWSKIPARTETQRQWLAWDPSTVRSDVDGDV
jgi:hypothetical protein